MLETEATAPEAAHNARAEVTVPAAESLAFVNHPALIVSGSGHVLACNQAAQLMLSRTEVLGIGDGVLRCARPHDAHRLAAELQTVAQGATRVVRMLQLGGGARDRLFLFLVRCRPAGTGTVLVSCFDPQSHEDQPEPQVLASCFGFTPSEARVAAAVAAGLLPKEIAVRNGTSLATVRTQLHCALVKAGVTRQSDLVRLMAAIPRAH